MLALTDLCREYGYVIGHEDHGAFIVEEISDKGLEWLNDAHISPELYKNWKNRYGISRPAT
jgi:hypothetical protein